MQADLWKKNVHEILQPMSWKKKLKLATSETGYECTYIAQNLTTSLDSFFLGGRK